MGICTWHGGEPEPCVHCARTLEEARADALRQGYVLKEDHDAALLQIKAMKPVVDAAVKLDQAYPKWHDLGLKGIDIQNALEVYYSRLPKIQDGIQRKNGPGCNIVVAGEYDLHCTVHDRTALECARAENTELRAALQGLLEDLKGSPQGVCIVAAAKARKALGISENRVPECPHLTFEVGGICADCKKAV